MKFTFTRHARERCQERGIRLTDIKSALRNMNNSMSLGNGLIQTTYKVRGKRVVVIFRTDRDIRIIITAYYEN